MLGSKFFSHFLVHKHILLLWWNITKFVGAPGALVEPLSVNRTTHMDLELDFDSPIWRKFVLGVCRRRCPKLSEEELAEATENFLNYMRVIWRQHRRMEADGSIREWEECLKGERMNATKQELLADFRDLLLCRIAVKKHELTNYALRYHGS